ncbi:dethiobiotin synthase [Flavisphingomonas formosensis]|uniref:dethiobiotin synthase n=1 Tax=Flavisphingomonas formosensis TaxID=861534 RepID=UPI0012FC70A9|nr:dethiobiotin synthase [Sphingomonas formosensis]
MKGFVVTGTGTGIGKTVFSAALVGALDGFYWKPVQSGLEEATDSETVASLAGLAPERILPEAWRLKLPASPHRSAAVEGVEIDPGSLEPPSCPGLLVIEGAGGLLVPLTRTTLFADLFARWGWPVVLCVGTGLGSINHALLSVEALRARGLSIHGLAFIGEPHQDDEEIICAIGGVRRLGRLPRVDPLNRERLAAAFAVHFDIGDFAA